MSGGSYNTRGRVVGETPSSGRPAEAGNPPLGELDALQLLLDLARMVPGAGAIPDLLNAVISAVRGDWAGAAIGVFSAIPAVGDAAGLAKVVKNEEKYVEALAVVESRVLPHLPENLAKPMKAFIDRARRKLDDIKGPTRQPDKPAAPHPKEEAPRKARGDTQVKARTAPEAKPKCFGGKQTRKNPAEYDRQLQMQQDALNEMSVADFLKNRERWDQMKRMGTGAEQAEARAKAISDMAQRNKDRLLEAGTAPKEAARLGRERAEEAAKGMDVLHSPDLNAGGSASGTTGLGDKGVNRSIGSNWGQNRDASKVGERVRDLDRSAYSVPEADRSTTKMNVKLKRCP